MYLYGTLLPMIFCNYLQIYMANGVLNSYSLIKYKETKLLRFLIRLHLHSVFTVIQPSLYPSQSVLSYCRVFLSILFFCTSVKAVITIIGVLSTNVNSNSFQLRTAAQIAVRKISYQAYFSHYPHSFTFSHVLPVSLRPRRRGSAKSPHFPYISCILQPSGQF